jgi:hypothetical protein
MTAAVNHNNGSLTTNTYATPQVANTAGSDSAQMMVASSYCAIPAVATDLANSVYAFSRIKSSDVIHSLVFASSALTAGAISLGLFLPNTKTVAVTNSDHLFATSINCASAVVPTEELYANLALTYAGKRVWEMLGLTSDPVLVYDIAGYSTTAATTAGTLALKVVWSP